jgi:hypothetical protein
LLTFVEIGADPRGSVADLGLMPLHLACMGCVEDIEQYNKLVEAAGSLYDLQVRADVWNMSMEWILLAGLAEVRGWGFVHAGADNCWQLHQFLNIWQCCGLCGGSAAV